MHRLTATAIKKIKPVEKQQKLTDGGGLYLLLKSNGGKYWRYDYRYSGVRKTMALGVYPEVTLKSAREKHLAARAQLSDGVDPGEVKKVARVTRADKVSNTFKSIALEWFETKLKTKSSGHVARVKRLLTKDLFPYLGNRPIANVTAPELLAVLRKVEARGAIDTAHRVKQTAGNVFRYAISTGRAERDPSRDLDGTLQERCAIHRAAITKSEDVGRLLVAIDGYQGSNVVSAALKLSPLLFQRPGEIRAMEWSEINWDKRLWEIPAEKMKMRQSHIVPLSSQSLELITELQSRTANGRSVSPRRTTLFQRSGCDKQRNNRNDGNADQVQDDAGPGHLRDTDGAG